ncbi:hypothetical protein [uncultured Cardiobacterium sp.]|uniref:Nmad2 family putative nucleotide modification protein n=1 Tax=uncultured Cardiobacterium sp. TaxID=417619 RepID=UPI0026087C90|nr:hypothetical protein [uncultured Cardiobacterium sp.]
MSVLAVPARLFSFPVFFDGGVAPFVKDGLASFALAQPLVRAQARPDDVLLGLAADAGQVRVVFVFVVDEVLPWPAYAAKTRAAWRNRVPHNVLDAADALWPPASRFPLPSWSGHGESDFARDIELGRNVLLSRRFWYFGRGDKVAVLLPPDVQALLPAAGFRAQANGALRERFARVFNASIAAAGAQNHGCYGQPQHQPELEGFDFVMSCSTLSASADGCGAQVEGRVALDVLRDAERVNDAAGECPD